MAGRRELARQQVLADLTAEARRQLARDGAAALSLRSVARELGMVSSAVYRYVASRDELLTMLLVAGYGELADAMEAALDGSDGQPPRRQWAAVCAAVRSWAAAHPQDYALLYGSPVPGYAAPADTIEPARRVYAALAGPLRPAGARASRRARRDVPPSLAADAERLAAELGLAVAPDRGVRFLAAVAQVFGLISFELFGHTHGVVTDHDAFFADRTDALADDLGL